MSAGERDEAREEILRRIRTAKADRITTLPPARDYELALPTSIDRVELFAERVADYRATVQTASLDSLVDQIGKTLRERGIHRLAVPSDLDPTWLASSDAECLRDQPPLSSYELDAVDGVLTACSVAIAETGTIVLDGGPGQGRRALSLLPDFHLCIVMADQIVGTVPEALERLDARRAQTWISGPSATSDIELQRVEGVHGPRKLDVVIVTET